MDIIARKMSRNFPRLHSDQKRRKQKREFVNSVAVIKLLDTNTIWSGTESRKSCKLFKYNNNNQIIGGQVVNPISGHPDLPTIFEDVPSGHCDDTYHREPVISRRDQDLCFKFPQIKSKSTKLPLISPDLQSTPTIYECDQEYEESMADNQVINTINSSPTTSSITSTNQRINSTVINPVINPETPPTHVQVVKKRKPLSLIQLAFLTVITSIMTSGQLILPVSGIQLNEFNEDTSAKITSAASDGVQERSKVKCDFEKYPSGGCADHLTSECEMTSATCVCRTGYPVTVNGRCFAYRDISDLCVTSRQCARVKGKCIDNNNEEVVVNEDGNYPFESISGGSNGDTSIGDSGHKSSKFLSSVRLSVGICKCSEPNQYYNMDRGECMSRVLGKKCFFNTDCFSRSHSYCDGSKCKCKVGFFHDLVHDECKPSLVTLCIYGSLIVNGTQKCKQSPRITIRDGHSDADSIINGDPNSILGTIGGADGGSGHRNASSVSALFWPVIAFFLVILLLRMLKEGMKRDCERVLGHEGIESPSGHRSHHRGNRTRSLSSSSNGNTASGRNRRSGNNASSSANYSSNSSSGTYGHGTSSQSLTGPRSRPYIRHYPIGDIGSSTSSAQIGSGVPLPPGTIEFSRTSGDTFLPGTRGLIDGTSGHPEIIVLMPPPPYTPTPSRQSINEGDDAGTSNNNSSSVIIPEEPPSYEEATRK